MRAYFLVTRCVMGAKQTARKTLLPRTHRIARIQGANITMSFRDECGNELSYTCEVYGNRQ